MGKNGKKNVDVDTEKREAGREAVSAKISTSTYQYLKDVSEKTGVPMTEVLDRAVLNYYAPFSQGFMAGLDRSGEIFKRSVREVETRGGKA